MRDLKNSKSGGLDTSWAAAAQKEKNDETIGLLNS